MTLAKTTQLPSLAFYPLSFFCNHFFLQYYLLIDYLPSEARRPSTWVGLLFSLVVAFSSFPFPYPFRIQFTFQDGFHWKRGKQISPPCSFSFIEMASEPSYLLLYLLSELLVTGRPMSRGLCVPLPGLTWKPSSATFLPNSWTWYKRVPLVDLKWQNL